MIKFNGGLVRRHLALFLAVIAPACTHDSATGVEPADAGLRLEAVSATQTEGTVGEAVNPVPAVLVTSETGRPAPGIRVTFAPLYPADSAYGDHVTNRISITDARGVASGGDWTLGTMAGTHGLEAGILGAHLSEPDAGVGRAVAFRTEAHGAAAASLSMSEYAPAGLPGDEIGPPQVHVTDRFGNNAGGVVVTFRVATGGGSLATTQVEASIGYASAGSWTLGPNPGLNSVVATAPGLNSVTFSARALDVGAVTWYDMKPQSVPYIEIASIALCENGTFELVTVETSPVLPGEWRERQLGTYTIAGTQLVLNYPNGVTEQGTLVADSLAFVHKKLNWADPPQMWTFARRL